MSDDARRSFWGWGVEGGGLDDDTVSMVRDALGHRFGAAAPAPVEAPRLDSVRLPTPRCSPPASIASIADVSAAERAGHTYGKAFRDVVRGLAGDFDAAPDFVAHPRTEADVAKVLEACEGARVAVIPYGGGSSVVGGVEARGLGRWAGACSLDLGHLDRVVEVDPVSRAARIQAGVLGPSLAAQLRPHGLAFRHYPQSFEFSSLGGWIATRAGGHYATLFTHVDDFVESMRVVTPRGIVETRRLPGSGAGPSPDRLFLGSEGTLGVITEAWMRVQQRPRWRAAFTARFETFAAGVRAVRELAQSGLHPTNCRLLDATEARLNALADGSEHLLFVAFESADHAPAEASARAVAIVREAGGVVRDGAGRPKESVEGDRDDAAGSWRDMFLKGPYLRDAIARLGYVVETFETAVTWDRFDAFHAGVLESVRAAVRAECGDGEVSCRFTHAYPDGPAPYFTVIAPGRGAARVAQWDVIKAAAGEAIVRLGGTITHHHAVGRDHRPWYDRERPPLFGESLRAVKRVMDPAGVLNPGVLFDA